MKIKIEKLLNEINNYKIEKKEEVENFRLKYLSKKGLIPSLFDEFKTLGSEEKKEIGKGLNVLKQKALDVLKNLEQDFSSTCSEKSIEDKTRPCFQSRYGSRHPINLFENEIISIFLKFGFVIAEGSEIEDDYHVFGALNFPVDHPARDMQDTFFINNNDKEIDKNPALLRTHTSSIQIRVMENNKPPIRIICPGRVFRNEVISARSHCMFHQIEGLYIAENVSFADLKSTMLLFVKEMFGKDTEIRFRPSYFPFTEPSAEMDISCTLCKGKGCNVCKYSGWLEIAGCGMVHPNVLKNCNIDSTKYSGFAFGMGVERSLMLKYKISDIRLLFENDVRFLEQFSTY